MIPQNTPPTSAETAEPVGDDVAATLSPEIAARREQVAERQRAAAAERQKAAAERQKAAAERQALREQTGGPANLRAVQSGPAPAEERQFQPGPEPVPQRRPEPVHRPAPLPAPASGPVARPARAARVRMRHFGIIGLAMLLVVLPGIVSAWYLWTRAVDQYVSVAGFAIRTEQASTPFDFLGAFGGMTSSTGKDMDILNDYMTSQQLVMKLDQKMNLRAMFSKPKNDPYYAYDTSGTIEDLVDYWKSMVVVNYDNTTGLMQLYVKAFTPEDAQSIAQAVLDESTQMINQLAAVAQEDTTRYSKDSLEKARAKLEESRAAMTKFRVTNNIVDPTMDLAATGGVIGSLTQQMVAAQVDQQILKSGGASETDPRVVAAQRRIDVIQARITEEQKRVSVPMGGDMTGYADMIAQYERLKADQEFDEKAYMTALATYDVAVTDAQHKSVYLATFEDPTLAEASTVPNRGLKLLTVLVIGFLTWSILTLVYYALRDRR